MAPPSLVKGDAGNRDSPRAAHQEFSMQDIFMLALGLGFFAITIGYAYACERL